MWSLLRSGSDSEPASQQTRALATVSSSLSGQQTSPLSDIHPHLLFLKTGGGATVAQPKRHLTPQQLQMLTDGSGTLEGLTVRNAYDRPTTTHAKVAAVQQQEPLGIATVVLEADQNPTQQLASLFTPRNDQAVSNTGQGISQPSARSIFSAEAETQGTDAAAKSALERLQAAAQTDADSMSGADGPVRPAAKSLQGVYLDQPRVEEVGFAALKSVLTESRLKDPVDPMMSLSWLDEPIGHFGQEAVGLRQKAAQQQLPERAASSVDQQILSRSSVLLTLTLSVATKHTQVNTI